jgi:peroxiredoxin
MTAKGYLVVGLGLIAAGAAWTTVRAVRQPAAVAPISDAAIPPAPSGDKVTLQFFRNRAPVAALSLRTLDGHSVSSADWRGKVTIVNFWATWCGPCTVEAPQFNTVYNDYKQKPVTFVGIDTKETSTDAAKAFVKDNSIDYPIVYDEQGETAVRLGNIPTQGMPFTVVIDRSHRVAAVYVGRVSPLDLEPVLNTLAAER